MDILILGILGLALFTIGTTGLLLLACDWFDYQVACWHYGKAMSRQQQPQRQAKRIIEIHIN